MDEIKEAIDSDQRHYTPLRGIDGPAVSIETRPTGHQTMFFGLPLPSAPVPDDAYRLSAAPASEPRTAVPRATRRLLDRILAAFHQACDQANDEVAQELLGVLDVIARRAHLAPASIDRRARDSLVAAHERLWHLRHPE